MKEYLPNSKNNILVLQPLNYETYLQALRILQLKTSNFEERMIELKSPKAIVGSISTFSRINRTLKEGFSDLEKDRILHNKKPYSKYNPSTSFYLGDGRDRPRKIEHDAFMGLSYRATMLLEDTCLRMLPESDGFSDIVSLDGYYSRKSKLKWMGSDFTTLYRQFPMNQDPDSPPPGTPLEELVLGQLFEDPRDRFYVDTINKDINIYTCYFEVKKNNLYFTMSNINCKEYFEEEDVPTKILFQAINNRDNWNDFSFVLKEGSNQFVKVEADEYRPLDEQYYWDANLVSLFHYQESEEFHNQPGFNSVHDLEKKQVITIEEKRIIGIQNESKISAYEILDFVKMLDDEQIKYLKELLQFAKK